MMAQHTWALAGLTVLVGLLAYGGWQSNGRGTYRAAFDGPPEGFGPLETIAGIPFSAHEDQVVVTERLAHLRVPYHRTGIGKRLTLTASFAADGADILEVGVRRGEFWLDYERVPLMHRILDVLAASGGWSVLRGNTETVFLNPASENARYGSVDDFLRAPPTDGVIGLYGNATLACAGEIPCTTAPFRLSDNPQTFRAIYARYLPASTGGGLRTATVTLPLDRAFQNPDGSFDVMFFSENRDGSEPRVALEEIRGEIRPAVPTLEDLRTRIRDRLRLILLRAQPI